MSLRKGSVVFITEHNPQSILFIEYIKKEIGCSVSLLPPDTEKIGLENDSSIILMDVDYLSDGDLQKWQGELSSKGNLWFAALNLRDEQHAAEMLSYMHFSGVFYRTDSMDMICKGIERIMEGHLWMSRPLMSHLIEFFRKQSLNSYRPACGLTQRELEIIGLLGSGASNLQIADRLFVSEHTVKSHLYNIFKKIDVHNRTQAVNWARHNLGAPPPSHIFNKSRGVERCSANSTR